MHTDGMGWTDRAPSDATTFGTALAEGTEQHTLLVTSKSPSPEIIYIGKTSRYGVSSLLKDYSEKKMGLK